MKKIQRVLRSFIRKSGYDIIKYQSDFNSCFLTKKYEDRLLDRTADMLDGFLNHQKVFELDKNMDTYRLTRKFYDKYKEKESFYYPGSSGFNALLCIYIVVSHMRPDTIIESGVYCGQSSWALRQASPSAHIHSFDIDLGNLVYRDGSINYHEQDWSSYDWKSVDKENAICFFDDHVDQIRRLLECRDYGFKFALFDDNTPVEWLHLATDGAPMLDFIGYTDFEDGEIIQWELNGKIYNYKVDLSYLKEGRMAIESIVKMPVPSLSKVNGYPSGNPLTLVKLKN